MKPRALIVGLLAAAALAAGGGVLFAKQRHASQAAAQAAASLATAEARGDMVLHVPHIKGAIMLDGDQDDPGWQGNPGRTGAFRLENGKRAVPFSEVRVVWGDGTLYLSLYASDDDIESHPGEPDRPAEERDEFHVVFTHDGVERAMDVTPTATIRATMRTAGGAWGPWESGAHASHEWDGTLNKPKDNDEEWVIEMALPFEALGLRGVQGETFGFAASRCDTPKREKRVCAAWGVEPNTGLGWFVLD